MSGVVYYLESVLYDISIDGDNLHWYANFRVKDPGKIDTWTKKFAADLTEALVDEKKGAIPTAN